MGNCTGGVPCCGTPALGVSWLCTPASATFPAEDHVAFPHGFPLSWPFRGKHRQHLHSPGVRGRSTQCPVACGTQIFQTNHQGHSSRMLRGLQTSQNTGKRTVTHLHPPLVQNKHTTKHADAHKTPTTPFQGGTLWSTVLEGGTRGGALTVHVFIHGCTAPQDLVRDESARTTPWRGTQLGVDCQQSKPSQMPRLLSPMPSA